MQTSSLLSGVGFVLVDVKTPANIGAVARCMMNMGLTRLVLVRPPRDPNDEARKLAAGADRILESARRVDRLIDAIADQGLVVGVSRHAGRLRKNIRTPRESAQAVLPMLGQNRASFVFGNEVNGLQKEDLALCHEYVSIPSSDQFPSLNLSHAVMVVAYELLVASLSDQYPSSAHLAPAADLENFYDHLQSALEEARFLVPGRADRIMFSLRQVFGRARLEPRDLNILHGVVSALQERKHEKKRN